MTQPINKPVTKLTAVSANGRTMFVQLPVDADGKVRCSIDDIMSRLDLPRNACIAFGR